MSENKLDWKDNIIRDGFTQRYYIAEDPGRHGSLSFNARPMMAGEVEDLEQMINDRNTPGRRALGKAIQVLAEKTESWSIEGLEPTLENWQRMRRPLIVKAYEMISSQRPTEIDPSWGDGLDPDELDIAAGPRLSSERLREGVGNF